MKGLSTGLKYALFAVAATGANLGIQRAAQPLCRTPFGLYAAMLLGTCSGLVIKYLLDKHFIFYYRPAGPADSARTFVLYALMSGLSTLVFWTFELLFHLLFASPNARYLGAVIGLAIGYSLKYVLDRHLVFQRDRRRTGRGSGQPAIPFQGGKAVSKRTLHSLFFIVPGLFYYFTASRTPGWADATLIVTNVVNLELGSWVNIHNLFHLLGYLWLKLFPPDNIHFYLLLLSAAFGTLTVYLVFLIGLELTARPLAAALGALALMVSHSIWWHSTMLEVYTLNTALMAAMFYLILRYNRTEKLNYLYPAAFCFGLALCVFR